MGFCHFLDNSIFGLYKLNESMDRPATPVHPKSGEILQKNGHRHMGEHPLDPRKNGLEVDFGRRGKYAPCHRIDELFKPNWPPRPSQTPRGPPPDPQERFPKKLYFFKPPWGGPGGSSGGLWGSGKAVGLEKLVDSMTCKLPPTTKIHLAPLFGGSSLEFPRHVQGDPRKVQKTDDN